ncbi:hypothetical protein NUU61_004878 [Penicillium alfredii]|uniref:Uncharacterized protein n=1 Tax=Penicillium alfredii TaxID=1506179 RepID=A0A9W9K806_9EURO|nr:uncharacterized protein NUU61_004878 [Penicillium alfredii]KAJ5095522.1 hypothetical protein NUU61_004878 [Penicillium alfredii]
MKFTVFGGIVAALCLAPSAVAGPPAIPQSSGIPGAAPTGPSPAGGSSFPSAPGASSFSILPNPRPTPSTSSLLSEESSMRGHFRRTHPRQIKPAQA